jgi:valyl-tRNA synthetase
MKTIPAAYYEGDVEGSASVLASQAWVEELRPGKPEGERFLSTSAAGIDLHLPITGLVDVDKLLANVERDLTKKEAELAKLQTQLANPQFVERAKPEAVAKLRENLADVEATLATLVARKHLLR